MADIGRHAQSVIDRLARVDLARPSVDRERVERAVAEHIRLLDLPPMPMRWLIDAEAGYLAAAESAAHSAAWSAALSAVWSAAWSAAESAAWSAAWRAAENAAWSAAESAAWRAARSAAESAAESAAWRAARSAAESAAESAAWSAAESAAWRAAWRAARSAAESAAGSPVSRYAGIWLPFVDAFEAGLWLFWVTEREILLVPRPALHVDGDLLHREDGPAVEWPDGPRYWFWRGVQVRQAIVEHPQSIAVADIDAERNAEVRRVMIERYRHGEEVAGAAAYVRDAGGEVLDDDPRFGRLIRRDRPDDSPLLMIEVRNSTVEPDGSRKVYYLRVNPECRPFRPAADGMPAWMGEPQPLTARNAVASTFGLYGHEYRPAQES